MRLANVAGLSIAGLSIVAAIADGQTPRLTQLVEFGCESCEGPTLFTGVQAMAVAPDGRIAVVDKSDPRVRIFDAKGVAVRTFGRTGPGPAELQTAVAVSVAANGDVEIVDLSRRRLARFGPTGEDRTSTPLGGFATAGAFAPQGGHVLAAISAPNNPVLDLVRVADGKAVKLLQLGDKDFPERPTGSIETLSIAVAPDGSIAVGDGSGAYLIRRYRSDGTPNGEIRRTIPKVRRTAEEITLELNQREAGLAARLQRMGARSASPPDRAHAAAALAERKYFEPYALCFDERGRLWVKVERTSAGRTMFDVFDPAGRYLGEVELPVALKEFAFGAGMLAAAVPDDLGVERIRVWRISGP
jgi:sugar lactone lactonase YvrE